MTSSDSFIEMISRHIVESDMRVSKRIRLIQRLQDHRLDTVRAEELLHLFQCDLTRRYDLFRHLLAMEKPPSTWSSV
jgi:hypothetical protein